MFYKCGTIYSLVPCPGAQVIATTDSRTLAQESQTDLAISRDARLADTMEKARLKRKKKDLAANTPGKKPLDQPASAKTLKRVSAQSVKVKRKKEELPEYFVVQRPGDKKKKSTSSKTTPAKDANQH